MTIRNCFLTHDAILMEGALGERLKREYRLVFDDHVAMATLVYDDRGRDALARLWRQYGAIAGKYSLPFLATTPTRRVNRERVASAGLDGTVIADNVRFLQNIRNTGGIEMYVGGMMGCRGDAYTGEGALSESDARRFHAWEADCFRKAGADFLFAAIMPTLPEAKGMAAAMSDTGMPSIISFTIGKNGTLIDGTPIHDAIASIDDTVERKPLCYMANCVHPAIVYQALSRPCNLTETVRSRFKGIQANTSSLSYAELDGAEDLKSSDPEDFSAAMMRLKTDKGLVIMGGCCGTDHRHMEAVARLMA